MQLFRGLGWDNEKLHDALPFQVVDPGFKGILLRACSDAADLATELGLPEIVAKPRVQAEKCLRAMETLWSDQHGQHLCLDRKIGALIPSPSAGGILAAFAPLPDDRAAAISATLTKLGGATLV